MPAKSETETLDDPIPADILKSLKNALIMYENGDVEDARILSRAVLEKISDYAKRCGFAYSPIDTVPVEALDELKNLLKNQATIRQVCDLQYRTSGEHVFFAQIQELEYIDNVNDGEACADAFDKIEYVNLQLPGGASLVTKLLELLSKYALSWAPETQFYAPYVALVNASMTGKSRSLIELANHGVFVIVLCLRPSLNDHYRPPRTQFLADWATNKDAKLLLFTSQTCVYFIACLEELRDWLQEKLTALKRTRKIRGYELGDLTKEWSKHVQKEGALERVMKKVQESRVPSIVKSSKEAVSALLIVKAWRSQAFVQKENDPASVPLHSEIHNLLQKLVKKDSVIPLLNDKLHVLFVVDEARQLNRASDQWDRFSTFRRACRMLPLNGKAPNMFVAMTDTMSKLANLAPSKQADGSLRVSEGGLLLYHPASLLVPVDVWWKAVANLAIETYTPDEALNSIRSVLVLKGERQVASSEALAFRSNLTLPLIQRFEFGCLMGRPVFYGMFECRPSKDRSTKIGAVLELLKKKILNEMSIPKGEVAKLTNYQGLAVMGAIASIEVGAASETASQLTSSHMRQVAAISEDRECLYTLEVSEPPLALAAHNLFGDKIVSWRDVMNSFISAACRSTTSAGFRGEVCGQVLFLQAWQKCIFNNPDGKREFVAIPATDFLDALFGSQLELVRERVENAYEQISPEDLHILHDVVQKLELAGFGKDDIWGNLRVLRRSRCEDRMTDENVDLPFVSIAETCGVSRSLLCRAGEVQRNLTKSGLLTLAENAVDAMRTLENYAELRNALEGAFVRVNQFVKTFSDPSKAMLFDYFIRASGIYCQENQDVIDLLIPIHYPSSLISLESFSAFHIQMKRRLKKASEPAKASWAQDVLAMNIVDPALPLFAIFCELNPEAPSFLDVRPIVTDPKNGQKRRRTEALSPSGFAVFSRGLKPSLIDVRLVDCDAAFNRMLQSTMDPSISVEIPESSREEIKEFFDCQPYYIH